MTSIENFSEHDRVAFVTGTSSGVGAAVAASLLSAGWSVVGVSRRPVEVTNPHYQHFTMDLSDTASLRGFAEENWLPLVQMKPWQRVGLVNNAAVLGALRGLKEADPQELAKVLAVNTVAPVYLMGFLAHAVPASAALRIVNISSGAATQGIAGLADYCGSKAALRLAGMALAAEFVSSDERDGAVLSYEPGVVDTPMQAVARDTTPEQFPSHQIFQEFAAGGNLHSPDAVVGAVVDFLASDGGPSFVEQRFHG